MKEVVTYIALIAMEFSNEATCNAFYKNYKSNNGLMLEHTPTCAKMIKFEGEYIPPPMPRPKVIEGLVL